MSQWTATWNLSFLSTLSLRRATVGVAQGADTGHISIHALLAESDISCSRALLPAPLFLSTLSLRRATALRSPRIALIVGFLSTLSLRRATVTVLGIQHRCGISIHALLAESDRQMPLIKFFPGTFLSTLSLRRATTTDMSKRLIEFGFLSTLSLRRATSIRHISKAMSKNFYPRSPCGERHTWQRGSRVTYVISIHALLAESDSKNSVIGINKIPFLSTLSLRRAT